MKASVLTATSMAALGMALALPAFSQPTSPAPGEPGWRMPYQRDFWNEGHAGISYGRAKLDASCPAGLSCDDTDRAFKVYAGGRFNRTVGGEVTFLHTGDFARAGGSTEVQALNFSLLAGIPIGQNSSVFGKLGLLWGHTETEGATGLTNSSINGWGPSAGIGAQIGITRNWAARVDWDRYRVKLPGVDGRENLDQFMIGAQYTFGGRPVR